MRGASVVDVGLPFNPYGISAYRKQETEVIPSPVVVDPVHGDCVAEKTCYECYWRNHTVPQSIPEAVGRGGGLDYGRFSASRKHKCEKDD